MAIYPNLIALYQQARCSGRADGTGPIRSSISAAGLLSASPLATSHRTTSAAATLPFHAVARIPGDYEPNAGLRQIKAGAEAAGYKILRPRREMCPTTSKVLIRTVSTQDALTLEALIYDIFACLPPECRPSHGISIVRCAKRCDRSLLALISRNSRDHVADRHPSAATA